MEEVIETTVVYHGSKERILELAAMLGVNISNKNGDSIAPKIIGKDITKLSTAQDCRTERKEITSSSKEKEGYRIADIQGVCEPTDESCIKASDFYDSEKSIVTEDTGIEKSALEGTQSFGKTLFAGFAGLMRMDPAVLVVVDHAKVSSRVIFLVAALFRFPLLNSILSHPCLEEAYTNEKEMVLSDNGLASHWVLYFKHIAAS
ncbi:hypothetical protein QYM36_007316 [Artemia franciscana]|uniref:Uncharacterized protein n=1 Tax=Artemia franciscana TaxID=6661 RepID=A0AA88LD53_ARTSF|nr:hypothetical protein QYM36_007316 [Artemia franciscana]